MTLTKVIAPGDNWVESIKADVKAEAMKAPDWVLRWMTMNPVDLTIIGFRILLSLN